MSEKIPHLDDVKNGIYGKDVKEAIALCFEDIDRALDNIVIADKSITKEKLANDVIRLINSKLDPGTTLAYYGITDAYTKDEVKNLAIDRGLKDTVISPEPILTGALDGNAVDYTIYGNVSPVGEWDNTRNMYIISLRIECESWVPDYVTIEISSPLEKDDYLNYKTGKIYRKTSEGEIIEESFDPQPILLKNGTVYIIPTNESKPSNISITFGKDIGTAFEELRDAVIASQSNLE